MSEDGVWVQLYIGKDKSGDVFEVPSGNNIGALKEAVKEKRPNDLANCDAARLEVYNAGGEFPSEDEAPLRPGKAVPTGTTDENPLRVVAPSGHGQQQHNTVSC
jgi:hypothetical protein